MEGLGANVLGNETDLLALGTKSRHNRSRDRATEPLNPFMREDRMAYLPAAFTALNEEVASSLSR